MFHKIQHSDYRQTLILLNQQFSPSEQALLAQILTQYEFDAFQEQALIQAALNQSRFDPNAAHLSDEDESTTICPHCINPPMPPLRDYFIWRQTKG